MFSLSKYIKYNYKSIVTTNEKYVVTSFVSI